MTCITVWRFWGCHPCRATSIEKPQLVADYIYHASRALPFWREIPGDVISTQGTYHQNGGDKRNRRSECRARYGKSRSPHCLSLAKATTAAVTQGERDSLSSHNAVALSTLVSASYPLVDPSKCHDAKPRAYNSEVNNDLGPTNRDVPKQTKNFSYPTKINPSYVSIKSNTFTPWPSDKLKVV